MKNRLSLLLLLSIVLSLLLCGCAGPEERAWRSGQKALAGEKYSEAAAAFEKAGSYQDSAQLLQYAKAAENLVNGSYSEASAWFQALGDFKDSSLMASYCQAREQEALMQAALDEEDADEAISAGMSAFALYNGLSLFRDSEQRAADCRDQLYAKATEWMNLGHFESAVTGFEALGDWQDCASLTKYCKAAALETQGASAEAAALYAEIPDVLDARMRAEAAHGKAYQQAVSLLEQGEYEEAANAFAELGSYQDAEKQRDNASTLLMRELLQSGAYTEALKKLPLLSDLTVFEAADPSGTGNPGTFLQGFISVWMNAHADVMNGFFSCNLLQPYLIPGGELDTQIRAELTNEGAPQNYAFMFSSADVTELLTLDEGFMAAKVRGNATYIGPEGQAEMTESLRVLIGFVDGSLRALAVLPA